MAAREEPARILTCYYRPKPGGFCKRLFRAIEGLLREGHEVHYLAIAPFPIDHPRCHFHRFPWASERTEGVLFWGIFHVLAPVALTWLGFRHGITHAFAFGPTYAAVLQPLRWLRRIPLTLFLRADTVENHRIKGRRALLIGLERSVEGIAMANVQVYTVSQVLADTVASRHSWVRPARLSVLRNDIPKYEAPARGAVGRPLRLGCAGILEARKNQELLLQAIVPLCRDAVHLALYGVGPDEVRLKRRIGEIGVQHKVTLAGWVPAERMWCEVDLLLVPSLHEGAPNVVLEALGRGVPVLASDIPEHDEILPRASLLPLDDPQAWSRRIEDLSTDSERRLAEFSQLQTDATVQLRFDWDAAVCDAVLGTTPV